MTIKKTKRTIWNIIDGDANTAAEQKRGIHSCPWKWQAFKTRWITLYQQQSQVCLIEEIKKTKK
jgi:hypothetical protein